MSTTLRAAVMFAAAIASYAAGQTLVGTEYRDPTAIQVAPGQVIPLLVTGLQTVVAAGGVKAGAVPIAVSLSGISVMLNQPGNSYQRQLPIFAVNQFNHCSPSVAPSANCRVTAITVQIPFDITIPNPLQALFNDVPGTVVTVSENGNPSQAFVLSPVTDQIHERSIVQRRGDLRGPWRAMISPLFEGDVELIRLGEAAPVNCEEIVTQIFEDARDDVYRYLVTLGLTPAAAQEATQEVFLRLYVSLRKGDRIENLRGWIFRVAHNFGLTVRARESNLRTMEPETDAQVADRGGNPEQALLERERRDRFHHAVEALSEQQRNCLYLRAEGFRYREIAEILGISDSTVGEFLRRAIRRLRKVLYV